MDTNDHQRAKELQNIPAHTAQNAAVSHDKETHLSPQEQTRKAGEHDAVPHEGDHRQALTHGKAASIEAGKAKH